MIDLTISNFFPASWHAAAITLPDDEDLTGFLIRLVDHLSPNYRKLWAWAPGRIGTREIVLATPDPGATALLLAHVLALNSAAQRSRLPATERRTCEVQD